MRKGGRDARFIYATRIPSNAWAQVPWYRGKQGSVAAGRNVGYDIGVCFILLTVVRQQQQNIAINDKTHRKKTSTVYGWVADMKKDIQCVRLVYDYPTLENALCSLLWGLVDIRRLPVCTTRWCG